MHFEMDIEVHSFPNNWSNILYCGTSEYGFPGIYIHPDSGTDGNSEEGFTIQWSTVDNERARNHTDYINIGETYHLQIDVTQGWLKITLDDEVHYNAAKARHTTPDNVPCWMSSPWDDVANVTVSNLRVYSGIDGRLYFPHIQFRCVSDCFFFLYQLLMLHIWRKRMPVSALLSL